MVRILHAGDFHLDSAFGALTPEQARVLFEHVWIYTYGVGVLCATRMCHFSNEALGRMLTTQFQAMMLLVKNGSQ